MAKHRTNPSKISTALIAISALLATGLTSQSALAATSAGPSTSRIVVSPSSTNKLNDVLASADAIRLTGYSTGDVVRVEISETGGGALKFTSISGLTAVVGGSALDTTTARDTLEFTATVADANTALANIQYVAGSSFETASISVIASYAGTDAANPVAFFKGNEHFYKFVTIGTSWTQAKANAAAETFNGMTGYLATSTSAEENAFITLRTGNSTAWLGGTDSGSEYQWRWDTGPEAGKRFFNQTNPGSSGTKYTGDGIDYANWGGSEPNGAGSGESYLELLSGSSGNWNDLSNSNTKAYIIEFGGKGENLTVANTSRNITVDVNYAEVKAATGNCVQNIANTTGVTVTDPNGDGSKCIVKFTNVATTTWRAPTGVTNVESLIVAGGGGGGAWVGGGGGAGGVILKTGANALSVTAGSTYTVTVGAGGTGASKSGNNATSHSTNGGNSVFSDQTAVGGGGGGSWGAAGESGPEANSGGSGGGGSGYDFYLGGSGTVNQGNSGGNGHAAFATSETNHHPGGGGGGASAAGGNVSGTAAGAGGAGITTSISGSSASYGGGGGGGIHGSSSTYNHGTVGAGGIGGGGSGAGPSRTNYGVVMTQAVTGQAGATNTGGGGGGAGAPSTVGWSSTGGAGGSGVVILSYAGTGNPTITSHPASATKMPSETATFTVAATSPDSGTLTYQWQLLTTSLTATWTDIAGATSASYTTGTLALSNDGYQYRAVVTNTIGSSGKSVTSNAANLTVDNSRQVNVNFTELDFNHTTVNTNYVNLKRLGTTTSGNLIASGNTITGTDTVNGKTVGDRVLFKNVTTRNNVIVDAVVTTLKTNGATITTYEDGAKAGGLNSYFQSDASINIDNGYVEYQFEFYQRSSTLVASCNASVTCGSEVKVTLQNVNVSAIDIDSDQWNDLTSLNSFTVSNPTNLKYCQFSTGTLLSTCTTNSAPSSYPGNVRFQGPSDNGTNRPQDMSISNYGSVTTFNVKFGRKTSSTTNYYGVAFKALSWGNSTPQTLGDVAAQFDIAYNGNGSSSGSVPSTQTGAVGTQYTVSANSSPLVRTGYTFAGWNTAANGFGESYAAGATILVPNGGVTLYAVWTASQFTLTYDAATNGGSGAPASSVHNAGASVTLSTQVPTKAGFRFTGWDTQANGLGTDFAAGGPMTMPGSNRTLYAQFGAATGTITYNGSSPSSGSAPANDVGTSGTAATVSSNSGTLEKTGYSFGGWFTNISSVVTDYAVGASINYPAHGESVTLYAKWIAVPYTLAYNSNGGSAAPSSVSKLADTQFALPASGSSPTRSGYTFAGWNASQDGTGTNYLAGATYTMPAANTTLYAKWNQINYNVTYASNAPVGSSATGSQTDTTNYALAQVVTVKSRNDLAVANYRFTGWSTAADGTGTGYTPGNTFNMPLNGITLYAQWVSTSIKLTYNGNGGNNVPAVETRTAGTSITLPATSPERTGYRFDGWCEDLASCPTPLLPSGSYIVPNTDTILYAKWTAIDYTFTYNANGGNSGPAVVTGLNVGGFVTVSNTVPLRTGYSFLGWNSNMAGTGTDYSAGTQYLMGATNAIIYAKWQGNPFTLTYNTNGGTTTQSPTSEGRTAGSTENISSTLPTRNGYTFTGWTTALNGTGTSYSAGSALTMPGSNLTLYAQWSAASNAVTYNANGGSGAPGSTSAAFGSTVTVSSTVPTRTGYTFIGWNQASGGGSTSYASGDTFSMPATSITLYAQWAAVNYLLSYDANGGTGQPLTQSIAYDPAATSNATVSATVPTRSGYDFLGWNTVANGSGTVRASSATFAMPAANVTLYAQWSLATYTVYYNANGGVGTIAPQPGRYNTTITLTSSLPTRTGYTFVGWNVAPDGTGSAFNSGATFTIPSNNTTMYAQWTAIPYTITYVANGGDALTLPTAVTGKTVGETVTLSVTEPTRTNWYFTGWNTAADGSGQTYAPNTAFVMPAADVNLYARWIQNTYQVSYNANGGSGAPGSDTTDGNGEVVISGTVPTRPGYTFLHWDENANDSGTNRSGGSTYSPSGHKVLYAIWDANSITVSYNVNGGAGTTPADQTSDYGTTIQLAGSGGFTNGTLIFQSWNTQANGSGTNYGADELNFAMPSSNITLYAIWSAPYFAVEFDPNGGTNAPSDQYAAPAQTVNIPSTAPVLAEHEFTAWSDVSTGNTYSAGSTITMPTANVTLVANYVRRASVGGGSGAITAPPTTEVLTYPKKLNLTVYFKGDRSYLTSATKTALKKLAATAKKYGYATNITIYGRVKETNDKSYDAKLSKARATNVAAYLKKLGVSGAFKVIAAGISPENKPISRRVDMSLYWNKR